MQLVSVPSPIDAPSIGVIDSGVGGLSVLREIHRLLPGLPTLYYADQAHLPYGARSAAQVRAFIDPIVRFLMDNGAAVMVLACHAASAAALYDLRARYPQVPFVGMEPAVKPAAEETRTKVIGVLTTEGTANGALYHGVLDRYTRGVHVVTSIAPELVLMVERDDAGSAASQCILRDRLAPLIEAGADRIVLACTHFPFLIPHIAALTRIPLVDPSAAVARQVGRVLPPQMKAEAVCRDFQRRDRYLTSGDATAFQSMIRRLTGVEAAVEAVALG
ncbi:MAG: glutamate racemase [Aggregatilineales bacterium]